MVTATLRKAAPATVTVSPPAGAVPPATAPAKKPAASKVIDVEATVTPPAPTAAPVAQSEPDLTALAGEPAPEAAPEAAPVPRQAGASAVTKYTPPQNTEGFEGDFDRTDDTFPQIKIVQGSGQLSKLFNIGTIIYGDAELLPPPSVKVGAVNPAIRFVPFKVVKQFREKLTDEQVKEGEMPRIFNSVGDVETAGLTTVWSGSVRPDNYAEPSARMFLLIELPATSEHPGFALELDGKAYAVAVMYAAGASYKVTARLLRNTAKTSLLIPVLGEDGKPLVSPSGAPVKKSLLYRNFWTLQYVQKTYGPHTVWQPVFRLTMEQTGPSIREYISALTSAAPEAVTEAGDE